MARLAQPPLPDGPLKVLNDELHALHAKALWPSVRKMASGLAISPETVRRAFTEPRVPVAGNLLDIVQVLAEGVRDSSDQYVTKTCDRFDALLRATIEADDLPAPMPATASEPELPATLYVRLATEFVTRYAHEFGAESLEAWLAPREADVAMALSELVVDAMAEDGDVDGLRAKVEDRDSYAGQRLAELYAEQGDDESLMGLAGDDQSVAQRFAAYQLAHELWAEHPHRGAEPAEPLDERIHRRRARHSERNEAS